MISAIFVLVCGFAMALFLFIIEKITAKIGYGSWLMNVYNYRVKVDDTLDNVPWQLTSNTGLREEKYYNMCVQ